MLNKTPEHELLIKCLSAAYNNNSDVSVCRQVFDISPQVHELYYRLDPVSLELLVTEVKVDKSFSWYRFSSRLCSLLKTR